MEPHRPSPSKREPAADRTRRTTRNGASPGLDWLEGEAVRYVARWEATRRGVAAFLERKLEQHCERSGEDPESAKRLIPDVVATLVDKDYVNDQRFAEQLFERMRRHGKSEAQIRARLRAKGVDDDITRAIEEARAARRVLERAEGDSSGRHSLALDVASDEDLEAAWHTARKRRLGPYSPDPERRAQFRTRHLGVLARQGFSSEVAHAVIDAQMDERGGEGHDEDAAAEFDLPTGSCS